MTLNIATKGREGNDIKGKKRIKKNKNGKVGAQNSSFEQGHSPSALVNNDIFQEEYPPTPFPSPLGSPVVAPAVFNHVDLNAETIQNNEMTVDQQELESFINDTLGPSESEQTSFADFSNAIFPVFNLESKETEAERLILKAEDISLDDSNPVPPVARQLSMSTNLKNNGIERIESLKILPVPPVARQLPMSTNLKNNGIERIESLKILDDLEQVTKEPISKSIPDKVELRNGNTAISGAAGGDDDENDDKIDNKFDFENEESVATVQFEEFQLNETDTGDESFGWGWRTFLCGF